MSLPNPSRLRKEGEEDDVVPHSITVAVEVFEQARERFLLHAFRSGRLSSKANAFSQAEALYLLSRPFVKAVALVFGHGHDIVGVGPLGGCPAGRLA